MDRESMRRLKLDRRLIRRRGWLSEEDLERALVELPDGGEPSGPSEPTEALPDESPEEPPGN